MGGGVREDGVLRTTSGGGGGGDVNIISPIGPDTKANSIPVTLATDEDPIDVSSTPPSDVTSTGVIDAVDETVSIAAPPDGYNSIFIFFETADFNGTISFEIEETSTAVLDLSNFANWQTNTSFFGAAAKQYFAIPVIAGKSVRVRCSAYTSGTLDVELRASATALPNNCVTIWDFVTNQITVIADTELPAAALLGDNKANPSAPAVGAFGMVWDGATWDRTPGNSVDGATVNLGTNNDVTITGPVSTKTDLTPSAPAAVSVGVASGLLVAANANRKGLRLVNTSSARVSLGFGAPAVLDSGITLYPTGSFNMDEYDFDTGAINAIASAAASNVGVQEFTT